MKNGKAIALRGVPRYARWSIAGLLLVVCSLILYIVKGEIMSPPVGRTKDISLPTALVRPFRGAEPKRHFIVYTPRGYDDPVNAMRRYPVIYLLHGAPGAPENFLKFGKFPQRMEQAVAADAMQPVIFVMPDGNYRGDKHGDSEWADSADGRDRFETWLVSEVIPWVDSHYRTHSEAKGRVVAGVSEGGFGAVNLALRNPHIFGGAIGLSGYYDIRHFGWGHTILGDDQTLMASNSPLFYVPDSAASKRIPSEWKSLKVFLGAGAGEKPYAEQSRRMADALSMAGMEQVTIETPVGDHDWNLWTDLFFRAAEAMLPPTPLCQTKAIDKLKSSILSQATITVNS